MNNEILSLNYEKWYKEVFSYFVYVSVTILCAWSSSYLVSFFNQKNTVTWTQWSWILYSVIYGLLML